MRAEPAAVPRLLLRAEGLPPAHLAGCRSLLAAFRPGLKTAEDEGGLSAAPCLRARRDENGAYTVSYFTAGADEPQQTFTLSAADCAHIASFPRAGREDTGQILLKRAVSGLMTALTGRVLPWGILVGVRPGKLADIMTERGWPPEEQAALLTGVYGVRPDKAALLLETAERQRPFFAHRRDNPSRAALYIAIPFCPSRCV
ncbi:MAG: hypothetical protein LBQ16_07200, partial [Gracilibacteraceae bacterium]|nr:hypothetical protein [Gracilibacteraceae bacterium]